MPMVVAISGLFLFLGYIEFRGTVSFQHIKYNLVGLLGYITLMLVILPFAVAPLTAGNVTVAAWPTASEPMSLSGTDTDTCRAARFATTTRSDEDDDVVEPGRLEPDDPELDPEVWPTFPFTSSTVPLMGA